MKTMSLTGGRDYLSTTDTAKLVRGALKRAFPGRKFSVRSHIYAGGSSIDVRWVDGPTVSEVEPLARRYGVRASTEWSISSTGYSTG